MALRVIGLFAILIVFIVAQPCTGKVSFHDVYVPIPGDIEQGRIELKQPFLKALAPAVESVDGKLVGQFREGTYRFVFKDTPSDSKEDEHTLDVSIRRDTTFSGHFLFPMSGKPEVDFKTATGVVELQEHDAVVVGFDKNPKIAIRSIKFDKGQLVFEMSLRETVRYHAKPWDRPDPGPDNQPVRFVQFSEISLPLVANSEIDLNQNHIHFAQGKLLFPTLSLDDHFRANGHLSIKASLGNKTRAAFGDFTLNAQQSELDLFAALQTSEQNGAISLAPADANHQQTFDLTKLEISDSPKRTLISSPRMKVTFLKAALLSLAEESSSFSTDLAISADELDVDIKTGTKFRCKLPVNGKIATVSSNKATTVLLTFPSVAMTGVHIETADKSVVFDASKMNMKDLNLSLGESLSSSGTELSVEPISLSITEGTVRKTEAKLTFANGAFQLNDPTQKGWRWTAGEEGLSFKPVPLKCSADELRLAVTTHEGANSHTVSSLIKSLVSDISVAQKNGIETVLANLTGKVTGTLPVGNKSILVSDTPVSVGSLTINPSGFRVDKAHAVIPHHTFVGIVRAFMPPDRENFPRNGSREETFSCPKLFVDFRAGSYLRGMDATDLYVYDASELSTFDLHVLGKGRINSDVVGDGLGMIKTDYELHPVIKVTVSVVSKEFRPDSGLELLYNWKSTPADDIKITKHDVPNAPDSLYRSRYQKAIRKKVFEEIMSVKSLTVSNLHRLAGGDDASYSTHIMLNGLRLTDFGFSRTTPGGPDVKLWGSFTTSKENKP